MNNTVEKKKGGKILDVIETVGNKLPHPYIMFLWLCLILAGISTVCSLAGVQVINPTTGETVLAKAIFSRDGIVWLGTYKKSISYYGESIFKFETD